MSAALLVVGVLLLVLVPSAERLDRRLTVNLAVLVGLVPAATYVPDVLGPRTPALLVLGLGAAVLVRSVAVGASLRPVTQRRDLAIGAAAALAAIVAWPLAAARTADRALAMLSTGIDHGYHYAMFLELRLAAVGSPLVAVDADGSGFAFDDYPRWFHRLLVVLADAGFGAPGSSDVELVRYAQLQSVVLVLLTTLATAAMLQALPRNAPAPVVVGSVAVVWSLWLGVPGALNLVQGHTSFLAASTGPAVLFLLLVAARRRLGPATLVAAAAMVLLAASWMLLVPLAAAAGGGPLLALWGRLGRAVRRAVLGVGALGTLFALLLLRPFLSGAGLVAVLQDGTVPRVHLVLLVVVLVGSPLLLLGLRRRLGDDGLATYLAVPAVALAMLTVLGGYMLASAGELTYYFWKLALGCLVAVLVVTTHALAIVAAPVATAPRTARRARVTALLVGFAAAAGLGSGLQEFAAPSAAWTLVTPLSFAQRPSSGEAGDVDLVRRLADTVPPEEAARTRLLATRPEDMNTGHALVWFHALSHSATHRAMDQNTLVYELADEPDDLALGVEIARRTLQAPDRRVLVTDPELLEAVRAALPADDQGRVSIVR